MGLAEALSNVEMADIEDDCFVCGQKLATPYVCQHGPARFLARISFVALKQ
jgi:hypothetical protein